MLINGINVRITKEINIKYIIVTQSHSIKPGHITHNFEIESLAN